MWGSDYRLDDRGTIPDRGEESFLYPLCPDQLCGPPSLPSSGYRDPFQGVKRGRGEMLTTRTNLVPSSRMHRSHISSFPWRLYGGSGTALLYFKYSDYGLDDRVIGVRSPAGAKDFSSSLYVQTGSGAHPASEQWVRGSFPRG
jgi:hypothetical protein